MREAEEERVREEEVRRLEEEEAARRQHHLAAEAVKQRKLDQLKYVPTHATMYKNCIWTRECIKGTVRNKN